MVFSLLPYAGLNYIDPAQAIALSDDDQGAECKLDIMLVMDRSNSMAEEIEEGAPGSCSEPGIAGFCNSSPDICENGFPLLCSGGGTWTPGTPGVTLLDRAKEAASGLISRFGADDQSGLTRYGRNSQTEVIQGLTANHSDTDLAVMSLTTDGGTRTSKGIQVGREDLLNNGRPDAEKVMVILGDGDSNNGADTGNDSTWEAASLSEAEQAIDEGVHIWTVKYGGGSASLFKDIANLSENLGTYRDGSPADITAIYDEITSALCTEPEPETGDLLICKYEDLSGDGKSDDDVPYYEGWRFNVSDNDQFSEDVVAGLEGCVVLSDLPVGDYEIEEDQISGWQATDTYIDDNQYADADSFFDVFVTVQADTTTRVDFYNYHAYCGNGMIDDGEECDGPAPDGFECNQSCELVDLDICEPGPVSLDNGGFEDPIVTNTNKWDIYDSVPGWTIEWESSETSYEGATRPEDALLELHRNIFGPASEGEQYAELDTDWGVKSNEPASVRIWQEVDTIPGAAYQLTFAFSPRPNTQADDNILEVKAGGAVLATIGPVAGPLGWSDYSYSFTASGETTRIEFADKGNPNSLGTFLDDVRLELIECPQPEPEKGSICGVKFFDSNQDGEWGEENTLSGWTITLQPKDSCSEGDEWADEVVSFDQGSNVAAERSNPDKALGEAENNDTLNFVSLGIGGELILKFDNFIENGAGDDLQVIETSYGSPSCASYPEYVHVYASQDGVNWTDLGAAKCQAGDPTFDLGPLPWAQYIKLADETDPNDFGGSADGFDVDGVRALNCLNAGDVTDSAVTTDNGYCFNDLDDGQYLVCEELQAGWINITPLCQQVTVSEASDETVNFGNYQEDTGGSGDSICGYKYEVDDEGVEKGTLSNWPMSLWSATYLATFPVNANDTDGYSPDMEFSSDKVYKIEVNGTAWAGDGIYFDAKYSERNESGSWTDEVQNYESYGPELLDLQINGSSPDWGVYNSDHTYFVVVSGDDSAWNFQINDIYYPNNEGSLLVTVYELSDTGQTTNTDSSGYYCFTDLPSGHYVVEEGEQDGYLAYGSTYCQVADSSNFDSTCDFYNYQEPATTGILTVCKYNDEDGDGDPQDDHPPVGAWTMTVEQDGEQIISGDTDDQTGCVSFELEPGSYEVYEAVIQGWAQTYPSIDGGLDYHQVSLDAGEEETVVFLNRHYNDNLGDDCLSNCGSPGGGSPTYSGGGSDTQKTESAEEPTVKGFEVIAPDLVKTADREFAKPGDIITYNVKVINSGQLEMTGVKVTDTLPDGMVFLDTGEKTKTWEIGTFPPGEQLFTYQVEIVDTAAAGVYVNTAVLLSNEFDPLRVEAPVNVETVTVLGYQSLPETGGDSRLPADIFLYFSALLILVGSILYIRQLNETE